MFLNVNAYGESLTIQDCKSYDNLVNVISDIYQIENRSIMAFEIESNPGTYVTSQNFSSLIKNNKYFNLKLEINDLIYEKLEKSKRELTISKLIVHNHNISCSECENDIIGIRYQCSVCEDFNLCNNCEEACWFKHEHPFLKLRSPENKRE